MIIHFTNQSQICQILKILKNIFFSNISWKETVKSGAINPMLNWYRKSISIKGNIYIYIEFLAQHFNDLSQLVYIVIYRVGDNRGTVDRKRAWNTVMLIYRH